MPRFDLNIDDFLVKVSQPEGLAPYRVLLLVHGWTGDENSMWVFTKNLPKNYLLVAPRAPWPSGHPELGGYSWVGYTPGKLPDFNHFLPAVEQLSNLLDGLSRQLEGNFEQIDLAGFSQGAALCYVFAMLHPQRVGKLAALAGFFPQNPVDQKETKPLLGKRVFIAHGTQDEAVPVEEAHKAEEKLVQAGAVVDLCLSDVGHRLGADCFKALEKFFR